MPSINNSSSQEWGEEGTQAPLMDDSPSYASGRNDGVSPFRPPHYYTSTAHFMNGETHFPTAMSYISDAQRSDVATVCSGSVVEDIEVESVLSQEDHPHPLPHSTDPHAATVVDRTVPIRRGGSGGRVVEFSNAPTLHNGFAIASSRRAASLSLHNMGPPSNRSLLLQKGVDETSSRPSSVRSFGSDGAANVNSDDCGGSLDVEAHSVYSQEDAGHHAALSGTSVIPAIEPATHKLPSLSSHPNMKLPTPASSVKSFGSQQGESDTAAQVDTDDCGGSLDVETHSVGARSIHSQEEAPPTDGSTVVDTSTKTEQSLTPRLNSLMDSTSDLNGRRSPGGTIYKGRGVRRYKGRYMNLPLKRFHQNGVNLDSVPSDMDALDPRRSAESQPSRFADEHWGKHSTLYTMNGRARRRSRSRSRSRSPENTGDRKPAARRQNGFHQPWQDRNRKSPPRNTNNQRKSPPRRDPRFRKNGTNGGQYDSRRSRSRSPKEDGKPRYRGDDGAPPGIAGALRTPRNGCHHMEPWPDRRRNGRRSRSPVASSWRRRRSRSRSPG